MEQKTFTLNGEEVTAKELTIGQFKKSTDAFKWW